MEFKDGSSRVSGTLYLMGEEHCRLLNEVYACFSHTNPMHADVFPSVRQMELEVVAMTASMLGGACFLTDIAPHHSCQRKAWQHLENLESLRIPGSCFRVS